MNWRRVFSVMRKEWWPITRDKTSFILLANGLIFFTLTIPMFKKKL